jgi:hypothetical protein
MKNLLYLAALLIATLPTLQAQTSAPDKASTTARPNFAGTWKFNPDKSEYGQVPPPTMETDVFTQSGDDFKIAINSDGDRGKEVYTLPFTAGGPESPTPKDAFPESAEFKILSVKGEWRKDTLVLLEKITYQGGPGTIMVICSLSPDGKQLTKLSHISLDLGEFDTKAVLDKQ